MSGLLFPFGETIVRLQPGELPDPYSGHPAPDWDNPTRISIGPCVIYPAALGAPETTSAARPEQVQQALTVLLPPGVELDPTDRVEYRGRQFDVIGFTHQFINPFTGWAPGGQATIQHRDG